MLRVTVELIPHGIGEPVHLGTAYVVNTGNGTLSRGNYEAVFSTKAGRIWKECIVADFPRKKLLAWDLLYRCLKKVVGKRNP